MCVCQTRNDCNEEPVTTRGGERDYTHFYSYDIVPKGSSNAAPAGLY